MLMLFASFFSSKNCNCTGAAAAAVPAVVAPIKDRPEKTISIADTEMDFKAGTDDNLLFPLNSCEYIQPLSEPLTKVFQDAVTHLNSNANRMLVLTGLYRGNETNECGNSQDLGYGRAEKVKSMLVGMGAPAAQIRTQSLANDVTLYDDNSVLGGVEYEFISSDIGDVEERLRAGNITLYFDTNKRNLSLTAEQQKYFDDLKYFIAQKPDAKISVSGHTDDRGDYKYNKRLSRKRAEFVRDYMVENGIPKKNIVARGFGPDKPLGTNDTKEGREKNRRVEIKIK